MSYSLSRSGGVKFHVAQGGEFPANGLLTPGIQPGQGHPFTVGSYGQGNSPGIDDGGTSAGGESGRVPAALIGRDDVGLILNGAAAQEDLPVIPPRRQV